MTKHKRNGCYDIWNAFMVKNAKFSNKNDIPLCNSDITNPPKQLISYPKAKTLYRKHNKTNPSFHYNAYVHFYVDDQFFDGKYKGIWNNPKQLLELLKHFDGAITPDYSTFADFPDPIKRYNTYRMRAVGYWLLSNNINIINNVRWGTPETWEYCFDGIPLYSIVAIGTVGSGLRKNENKALFINGFFKMIDVLKPKTIIIYGSSNYYFIQNCNLDLEIICFESETSKAFKESRKNE